MAQKPNHNHAQWPKALLIICIFATFGCSNDDNQPQPENKFVGASADTIQQLLDDFFVEPQAESILFRQIRVVDPSTGNIEAVDLLHEDGIVQTLASPGTLPEAPLTIDGSSLFAIPGLSDMHVHTIGSANLIYDLFLYLSLGITNVRVMWGTDLQVAVRDSIRQGLLLGPNFYVASQGFDGTNEFWPLTVVTRSAQEVREKIDEFHGKGYDFIKVYSSLPSDQFEALASYATSLGMPPIGHVPTGVDIVDAIQAGQKSIEHFTQFRSSSHPSNRIFDAAIAQGTVFCPTLTVINRSRSQIPTYTASPYVNYLSPSAKNFFQQTESQIPISSPLYEQNKELMVSHHRAGVKIISGTDTGIRWVLPGVSLHEEFASYASAGLSPLEILQTSTINVAAHLEDNSLAQISEGSSRSFVILKGNPLTDVANLQAIEGIVVQGRWVPKARIDEVLQLLEARYN